MAFIQVQIRPGAYYDSVVLMQLQQSLSQLPDVLDVGVAMGTEANKNLLRQSEMLPAAAETAAGDDLIVVVKGKDEKSLRLALSQIDGLLNRRSTAGDEEYRPRSLETAVKMLPQAGWVIISVPGRYAAEVAQRALDFGKNVFLYSDNVSIEDEVILKQRAAQLGLMVMGPDCGTAIVNGTGLGFANKVRRGNIGVVGASGTGLQVVTSAIHRSGAGITHALGTGGHDLSQKVGAITAIQALDLLGRDEETRVIILISKPPAPEVAEKVLHYLTFIGKPAVVDFIGYTPKERDSGNIHFAATLEDAARIAVRMAAAAPAAHYPLPNFAAGQRYLRGIFSGGTLAYEALILLRDHIVLHSNISLDKVFRLNNAHSSQGHTIVDLGEDEFTVGRLHPMMDNALRIRRIRQEAEDPEVAVILVDVVLGHGAHKDPAGELSPAIREVRDQASQIGRHLEVVAVVIGTDEDPQDLSGQIQKLTEAGARVETSPEAALRYVDRMIFSLDTSYPGVSLQALQQPVAAINVGVEFFVHSLYEQGKPVIQVQWKPPAGGNEKLMDILRKMKRR